MPSYASFDDMLFVISRDEMITLTDRNDTGEPNQSVATHALELASAEADAYLGKVYSLPLSSPPAIIKAKVIDMAVYGLARNHGLLTDDIKDRNKDALRFLRDLAEGKASLGLDEPSNSNPGTAEGSDGVLFIAPEEQLMSRQSLKGM